MHSSVSKGFFLLALSALLSKSTAISTCIFFFSTKIYLYFWLNKFLIINFNVINLIYQSIINLFLESPCT